MSAPFVILDWPPHIAQAPGFAVPHGQARPCPQKDRKGWLRVTYASRDELRDCLDAMQVAWAVQQWRAKRTA